MKTLFVLLPLCALLAACTTTSKSPPRRDTLSSFDVLEGKHAAREIGAGMIQWRDADLQQVLAFYQEISRRTVVRSPSVPPNIKITFRNEQPVSAIEALRLLDTVFAQHGIAMVYQGDDIVKAVPAGVASTEAPPEIDLPAELLPESSSLMMRTVRLKHITADHAQGLVAPFTKLPQSVIAVKGAKVLILRDYSSNVRKMLSVLAEVDRPETAAQRAASAPARRVSTPH